MSSDDYPYLNVWYDKDGNPRYSHPNLPDWFDWFDMPVRQRPVKTPGYTIEPWITFYRDTYHDYPKGDDKKWRVPMTMPFYTIPACGARNESKLLSLLED